MLPFCIAKGQFKLARILLIWNEHIFALQTDMEKHEHFGVEGSGADTVVVPFKEAQLLITAILGQQSLRVCLGHKGVINCMTCNANADASATYYIKRADTQTCMSREVVIYRCTVNHCVNLYPMPLKAQSVGICCRLLGTETTDIVQCLLQPSCNMCMLRVMTDRKNTAVYCLGVMA